MLKVLILVAISVVVAAELVPSLPPHMTRSLAAEAGYPIEEHSVTTSDGYVLGVYRIPGSPSSPPAHGKTVVFLQHGLLCSSADWLVLGEGRSIAYLLANRGYDVWLGNARGNTNSRRHVSLSTSSYRFWDFSWDEIGRIDLPAMIDYALSQTGQSDLHYIGHSQGTTSFFVMGAERPEMNAKIRTMHAMAPVAYMSHLASPMLRVLAPSADILDDSMALLGIYEFLPSNELMKKGGKLVCQEKSPFVEVCANVLFLLCGFNSDQLERSILPVIMDNTPAGSSVNQLVHYAQGINSGKFRRFNHGVVENLIRYGSIFPPEYNLKKITAKVFLHYSDNDWMAAVRDVELLGSKLGNVGGYFKVPDPKFNHLDFTYAKDAHTLLYDRVMSIIESH